MSHLSVAKFGGTSVANYSAMQACAKIVIADPNTRVVVLSASAGVTNLLVALANGVEAEERAKLIGEVRQIQENILNELKDDSRVRPIIEKYLENIVRIKYFLFRTKVLVFLRKNNMSICIFRLFLRIISLILRKMEKNFGFIKMYSVRESLHLYEK